MFIFFFRIVCSWPGCSRMWVIDRPSASSEMTYDMCLTFTGVVGRRYSVSVYSFPPILHVLIRYTVRLTGAPRRAARTKRSTDTSSLSYTLYSSSPVHHLSQKCRPVLTPFILFSCSLYRVDYVYDYSAVRRRVRSSEKRDFCL